MDTYHQRYLAEEVAEDHALGLMTRREAIRRLGMMGFSAFGASALLAACGGDSDDEATGSTTTAPAATGPTPTTAAAGATPADTTETITYPSGRATPLTGAWAKATDAKGAVVVIHENRGLTTHIRSVASRLAASGTRPSPSTCCRRRAGAPRWARPTPAPPSTRLAGSRFVADVKSTLDELAKREPGAKLGVIGFCFGGTTTWAVAGQRRAPAGGGRPLLRHGRGRRRLLRHPGGRPRRLRRDRRPGQRHPRHGRGGPGEGGPHPRATDVPRRRPRLLQRHRPRALQRHPGRRRLRGRPRLVRPPPGLIGAGAVRLDGHSRKPLSNSPGQPRRSCSARRTAASLPVGLGVGGAGDASRRLVEVVAQLQPLGGHVQAGDALGVALLDGRRRRRLGGDRGRRGSVVTAPAAAEQHRQHRRHRRQEPSHERHPPTPESAPRTGSSSLSGGTQCR